jgi:UDP-glucose 4-epimerase
VNILITGSKGFIGKELSRYFSEEHNVISTDRTTLDPTKYESVKSFFDNNKIDVVIHTAVKGGKRGHQESIEDLYENLFMFENLSNFSNHYKAMFNFGSGAEFDRRMEIKLSIESEIESRLPSDYYGLAKNLITRKINHLDSNIYNLRLFGCFGEYEEPQRLLRATYDKIVKGESPNVHNDKWMDYFYAQDIGRVIEYIVNNIEKDIPKDINLCYNEKYKLSDLVYKIKNLTESNCDVIIYNNQIGSLSYTGDSARLDSLNIALMGIDIGVEKCLKSWKKY